MSLLERVCIGDYIEIRSHYAGKEQALHVLSNGVVLDTLFRDSTNTLAASFIRVALDDGRTNSYSFENLDDSSISNIDCLSGHYITFNEIVSIDCLSREEMLSHPNHRARELGFSRV